MSDAPERIWAWAHSQRSFLAYEDKPDPPANPTEYVRADLYDELTADLAAMTADRDEWRDKHDHMAGELERLRTLLRNLSCDVEGLTVFEIEVRQAICNTNWESLMYHNGKARAALGVADNG